MKTSKDSLFARLCPPPGACGVPSVVPGATPPPPVLPPLPATTPSGADFFCLGKVLLPPSPGLLPPPVVREILLFGSNIYHDLIDACLAKTEGIREIRSSVVHLHVLQPSVCDVALNIISLVLNLIKHFFHSAKLLLKHD